MTHSHDSSAMPTGQPEIDGVLWQQAARLMLAAGRSVAKLAATPIELALARSELVARNLWPWRDAQGHVVLVHGVVPEGPRVAIVGSRAVDDYGRSVARQVAFDVGAAGGIVVSGGAEGVDAEAHEAALDAGTPTIVVLGHGHDHCYPREHAALFHRVVASGGALISPFGPTTRPARHRFLSRNVTIAGVADAVVVARAAARSGSLSTARAAHAAGKPLFAVPGTVGAALSHGGNLLLASGARAVVGGEDWQAIARRGRASPPSLQATSAKASVKLELPLDRACWPVVHANEPAPWSSGPDLEHVDAIGDDARCVLEVLTAAKSLDRDALADQTGLGVSALNAAVVELEIVGLVSRRAGGILVAAR